MNAFLKNIKAFLENIKAFLHIAHDGTLHLANKLEICVFLKKLDFDLKTQVKSSFSPKTWNDPTAHRNISIRSDPEN